MKIFQLFINSTFSYKQNISISLFPYCYKFAILNQNSQEKFQYTLVTFKFNIYPISFIFFSFYCSHLFFIEKKSDCTV